jgi:hypothetical protein
VVDIVNSADGETSNETKLNCIRERYEDRAKLEQLNPALVSEKDYRYRNVGLTVITPFLP